MELVDLLVLVRCLFAMISTTLDISTKKKFHKLLSSNRSVTLLRFCIRASRLLLPSYSSTLNIIKNTWFCSLVTMVELKHIYA